MPCNLLVTPTYRPSLSPPRIYSPICYPISICDSRTQALKLSRSQALNCSRTQHLTWNFFRTPRSLGHTHRFGHLGLFTEVEIYRNRTMCQCGRMTVSVRYDWDIRILILYNNGCIPIGYSPFKLDRMRHHTRHDEVYSRISDIMNSFSPCYAV